MKSFIHEDFLLENEYAKEIYQDAVKDLPIIDYHCHLDPKEIYEDKKFQTITEAWLSKDHYKWRLLRTFGVTEEYITGNRNDYDKFMKWAETIPYLLGNPIYHWTHLELKQIFGIDTLLSLETADKIYQIANEKIKNLSARTIIEKMNVQVICTTDDPCDNLKWHQLIKEDNKIKYQVLPTFRPDKAISIEKEDFFEYISRLSSITNIKIKNLSDLQKALKQRLDHFQSLGCKISDHSLEHWTYIEADAPEVDDILCKRLAGTSICKKDIAKFKSFILTFLGQEYHRRSIVQQYHIGAIRNVSDRMYQTIGPDTGYDAIGDTSLADALREMLNSLDKTNQLPKTIIYTLNPSDFEVAITIMQGFQGGGIPSKIQFGSAWWFLDSIDGMEKQMKALASNGILALFVGMLTDSRSFLSYSRHDYFRRILCNYLGNQITKGLYPEDLGFVKKIAKNIAYFNAESYFDLYN